MKTATQSFLLAFLLTGLLPAQIPPPPATSVRVKVTVSHMAISTLRAVAKRPPESAGLYTIRVCSLSALPLGVSIGHIHQGIEEVMGFAIIPKALADPTIRRSRSLGLSIAAKAAEVAGKYVAPVVLAVAAGGQIDLNAWQSGVLAAATLGLRVVDDATRDERADVAVSLTKLGLTWSSDAKMLNLGPMECTPEDPPMIMLGSYRRGQKETSSFLLGSDPMPSTVPPTAPSPVAPSPMSPSLTPAAAVNEAPTKGK